MSVELGDLWKLGNHRLLCGDSTSKADVERLLRSKDGELPRIDLCFADPPYGYKYESGHRRNNGFGMLLNDDTILDFFPIVKEYVQGFVFCCTSWKVLDQWIPLFKSYFPLTNMIVWNKRHGGMGDLKKTFSTDYEIMLVSNQGNDIRNKRIGPVWECMTMYPEYYVHPTQKPVALSEMVLKHTTDPRGTVFDIFGGSGTTLLACEHTGRNCFTMEMEPKYCEEIIRGWERMTGKTAVKEEPA